MVIEGNSQNSGTIQRWIEEWHPAATRALRAFAPLFEGKLEDAEMPPLEGVGEKLDGFYRSYGRGGLTTFEFRHSLILNRNNCRRFSWQMTQRCRPSAVSVTTENKNLHKARAPTCLIVSAEGTKNKGPARMVEMFSEMSLEIG